MRQARDGWRMLADVAGRMGFGAAFGWKSSAAVFDEYARLSGVAGAMGSDFDISNRVGTGGCADMQPFVWPDGAAKSGGRFFADGRFHHAGGKARMLAITLRHTQATSPALPFRLNTGRIRDQWHSMIRTGLSARLSQHIAEPFLEIHPSDAADFGLAPATLAQVTSPHGHAVLRVLITERVAKGEPFAPVHWSGENAPAGRINAEVFAVTDPILGQPDSKCTLVALTTFPAQWFGFAVSTSTFRPDCAYWAAARTTTAMQAELAGTHAPQDWAAFARRMYDLPDALAVLVQDHKRGVTRLAFQQGATVVAAISIAAEPVAVARGFWRDLWAIWARGNCWPDNSPQRLLTPARWFVRVSTSA